MLDKGAEANSTEGLVCAYLRGSEGQWHPLEWAEVERWRPEDGLLWVHLDARHERSQSYLKELEGLSGVVHDALLAEETRPRTVAHGDGLLAIFRGVNLNPGADPEDMVSVRLWVEEHRLLSVRRRRLMAIEDVRQTLPSKDAPDTTGALFTLLAAKLVERMAGVIEELDEEADRLETEVVDAPGREVRGELAGMRRQAIALRRYLAPQRDALSRLQGERYSWLDARTAARLREVNDRVIRYVEDLDMVRERAAVIQDELMNRQAERMNQNMYMLAIVATVMLPLGFVTGLLGVNIDGMPWASDAPWAFGAVSAALIFLGAVEIWLLRRLRWF